MVLLNLHSLKCWPLALIYVSALCTKHCQTTLNWIQCVWWLLVALLCDYSWNSHEFSGYAACTTATTTSAPSTCSWTTIAQNNDPCKCRNVGSLFSSAMKAKFALSYGESCGSWDMTTCATNYRPDQVDTWCCSSWCYVDKACPTAKDSLNDGMNGTLFWSGNACPDDSALMLQCPYFPQKNASAPESNCTCIGEPVPEEYLNLTGLGLNTTTYANYGTFCGPHDSQDCHILYPGADMAMWCCLSWCYVPETCATGRGSTIWPGHYFSYDQCGMDRDVVSKCPYDNACDCRGVLPTGSFSAIETGVAIPDNYGSKCAAWDNKNCKEMWLQNPNAGWNDTDNHATWHYLVCFVGCAW